jgi:ABC-type nickel/cobalt efflux system permease component RcnA
MTNEVGILLMTAVSIGFLHTILGPDHYIPFVAMAKANDWSTRKTALLTGLCGIAHVLGSVVIGMIGIMLGSLLLNLETLESLRGELAAWMLIAFGVAYFVVGVVHVFRSKPHTHVHLLPNGKLGQHDHAIENAEHSHFPSETVGMKKASSEWNAWTPWLLFLVFAFGPCEALIPVLMYPAAQSNWFGIIAVIIAFTLATLFTMIGAVLVALSGLRWLKLPDLHRFSHALAGAAILICGLSVKFGL